jgi:hypothetical protein
MSLQRVLETARKTGAPVIVTDVAGREPMVILPLEQFEALTGVGSETVRPAVRTAPVAPRRETKIVVEDPVDRAFAEMAAERLKNRMEETAVQIESLADQAKNPEISLEERFYLEPVDDKGTI